MIECALFEKEEDGWLQIRLQENITISCNTSILTLHPAAALFSFKACECTYTHVNVLLYIDMYSYPRTYIPKCTLICMYICMCTTFMLMHEPTHVLLCMHMCIVGLTA